MDAAGSASAHRNTPKKSIDWQAMAARPGLKRVGHELRGPCPVSGDGKDTFWLNMSGQPEPKIGCHKCGDGSGALRGDVFKAHVDALGGWKKKPSADAWTEQRRWTWTTADGRKRDQVLYLTGSGKSAKRWQKKGLDNPPRPSDLLYFPSSFPDGGPVLVTEGASDADAAAKRGAAAFARYNARPSAKSLARLDSSREYWITPDCDAAGDEQAENWYWALRGRKLTVRIVDMAPLRPKDAGKGWDLRNLAESLPAGGDLIETLRPHLRPERKPEEAREGVIAPDAIPRTIAGAVTAFGALGIQLRFNTLNAREEFRYGDDGEWTARVDGWESAVRADVEARFEWQPNKDTPGGPALMTRDLLTAAIESQAWRNRENPMLTWLEALPPWDGEPRIDTWLSTLWDCAHNPPELLKWACCAPLIACCQRQEEPGTKHDELTIWVGPQGLGKSSVLRALCPNPDKWFSDGLNLAADEKARIESLIGHTVVEVPDLQGMTKLGRGGAEDLKAFLSKREDRVRLSYRRNPEDFPRMAVMFGTANPSSRGCLLYDESGVRRFIVIQMDRRLSVADAVAWTEKHRDQLWAEAWARRGEPAFLPAELANANEEHSGQFQPEDEDGEKMIDAVLERAGGEPFSLPAMLDEEIPNDDHERRREWCNQRGFNRLGGLLTKRGYRKEKIRRNGRRPKLWHLAAPGLFAGGAEEEELRPDEDSTESPRCEKCGITFLEQEDGVRNLCLGCRD